MKRWRWAILACACAAVPCGLAVGCGGSQTSNGSPDGSAGDSTAPGADGSGLGSESGSSDATDGASDGALDAGACAPPSDPSQAALCVSLTPETIHFLADPDFDGKGLLVVQVFSRAHPDDDAGDASVAGPLLFPALDAGGADGGLVDLSRPLPQIRFDGLAAATVFVRAIFVDNPSTVASGQIQAGWWIGGLDLARGLDKAPLKPVALAAGQGTLDSVGLVALRDLVTSVSLAPGVVPTGNAQGPVTVAVVETPGDGGTSLFGAGSLPCGNVSPGADSGSNGATVPGFVIGPGPYQLVASLDEYGTGALFPPGGLVSFTVNDAGALVAPATDTLVYAAQAYQVSGSVALTLQLPWDGGPDAMTCP